MVGNIITEFTNSRTRDMLVDAIKASSPAMPVTIVDVRWNTYYPLTGEYRPATFGSWLQEQGFNYVYYQRLGNPFKDMADVTEMERKYKEYAQSQIDFGLLVDGIIQGDGTFCLLCYCKPPKPCHRYWLQHLLLDSIAALHRDFKCRDGVGSSFKTLN